MSQSQALYRISKKDFAESNNDWSKIISRAKENLVLQGSFMALEFILRKEEKDKNVQESLEHLFNPDKSLDIDYANIDWESLSEEEELELFEKENTVVNLSDEKVLTLNGFLEKLTEKDITSRYNAKELNENDIYSSVWHNDNSPDQAYNLRHLLADFEDVKKIFKKTVEENDIIVLTIG